MKTIILLSAILLTCSVGFSQVITGRVRTSTDTTGIPGINVIVKGTYSGTHTDLEGNFNLNYGKLDSVTLVFSSIGYEPQEQAISIGESNLIEIYLVQADHQKDAVVVAATRANRNTATAYSDIDLETIESRNFGQDIPYLLELEPSVVVTSDAGAGVGYSGIRIRGSDPTRINVTMNGVPVNDSESHGVWWVNMPDFASSVDNIQVQRGVGTSSNGAAAFGGSLNMQTNTLNEKPHATLINGYGSFNTWRHTISGGSGLIAKHFSVDARVSWIRSDGYVDRASSDLKSFYVSAAYRGKTSLLRFNAISGLEETYQAWYGIPEDSLNTNRTFNPYTYENEIDHYQQSHYQFIYSQKLGRQWNLNLTGHYTRGQGFYEQYRTADPLATYGLETVIEGTDTTAESDFIRRRWLDNHFYGFVFSINYTNSKRFDLTFGGGWNQYLGKHYGEVIWAEYLADEPIQLRYYEDDAKKNDLNYYLKLNYLAHKKVNLFLDLQFRTIKYTFDGPGLQTNYEVVIVPQTVNWNFFNPKFGINYEIDSKNRAYTSLALGNREPTRDDLTASTLTSRPKHETMYDWELGYERRSRSYSVGFNAFWMVYKNQLVLTGAINDVGAYTRQNVDWSDRYGVELMWSFNILKNLRLAGNFTWSQGKIWDFTEYIDDYDTGEQMEVHHGMTDISFSPEYIASANLSYEPVKDLTFSFITKYVGEQFLDNTSNRDRMLDDYAVNNLRIGYSLRWKFFKEIGIGVQLNNIFNQLYESNGYTFSYIYDGETTTENYYYPQAGFNFMTMLTLKF